MSVRPSNLPNEIPRRLWRGTTGRCTPLDDRSLTTADERRRREQLQQMQESLEEQGITDHRVGKKDLVDGSLAAKQGQVDSTLLKRGVYVHDARSHWIDPLHKSERRQACSAERQGVRGDIEYDAAVDCYRPSSQLSQARRGFTDSERLAMRSFSQTPQPRPEKFFSAARLREGTPPPSPSSPLNASGASTGSGAPPSPSSFGSSQRQKYVPDNKPLVQVYHERLKRVEDQQQQQQSSPLPPLATTPGSMRSHIADATANFFGQRHAPTAMQAGVQAPRDSAASILHGHAKNLAGHHTSVYSSSSGGGGDGDSAARRKTRALKWKQERFERQHFIEDRREHLNVKQDAVESTKAQRAASRSLGPYDRDADYLLRRNVGVKVNTSSPVRSTASRMGNWLFDYPTKG